MHSVSVLWQLHVNSLNAVKIRLKVLSLHSCPVLKKDAVGPRREVVGKPLVMLES